LVYGLGGWLAIAGTLDAGTVVSLALLLTRLYSPLTALANVRVDVMTALVSFERIFEVLDIEDPLERHQRRHHVDRSEEHTSELHGAVPVSGLRARWVAGHRRHAGRGHGRLPGAAAGPAVLAVARAGQRPGRRDDGAGVVRADLRGTGHRRSARTTPAPSSRRQIGRAHV